MFVPCHEQCVFAHAWGPATHCLTLILIAAAALHLIGTRSPGSEWIAACLAVLLAPAFRPLLNYYYGVWTLDSEALEAMKQVGRQEKRQRMKRALSGAMFTKPKEYLSSAALDNIELTEDAYPTTDEVEFDLFGEPSGFPKENASYIDTLGRLSISEQRLGDNPIEVELQMVDTLPVAAELTNSLVINDSSPKDDRSGESDDQISPTVPFTAAPVIFSTFLVKGHVINAIFAIIISALAFFTLTQFRTSSTCGALKQTLLWTLLLDFAVVQPLIVALNGLYRWMTANGEEGEWSSELHPFDGALRPF